MSKIERLIYCLGMCLITMAAGGYFTQTGVTTWYHQMLMPTGTPDDGVFPVVWSILYLTLAIGFYLAFLRAGSKEKTNQINSLFINQLFLQILWCFTFFYTGYILLALIIIFILDLVIFRTIYYFYDLKAPLAAIILIPYCAWILYATYLNASFVLLNGYVINF